MSTGWKARWTVSLRETAKGWEWRLPSKHQHWWGPYKARGLAISAAKRSLPKVIGRSNPDDFEFVDG